MTDASWLATVLGGNDWKPAKIVADYGAKPWGDVFNRTRGQKPKSGNATASTEVIQPADIQTLPGFQVELIHTVSKEEQGSWVGLTVDDHGRLLATDQYGGLYRLTPSPVGSKDKAKVEKLAAEIAGAHGLLYAFDSLYVLVNEKPHVAGLYRLRTMAKPAPLSVVQTESRTVRCGNGYQVRVGAGGWIDASSTALT